MNISFRWWNASEAKNFNETLSYLFTQQLNKVPSTEWHRFYNELTFTNGIFVWMIALEMGCNRLKAFTYGGNELASLLARCLCNCWFGFVLILLNISFPRNTIFIHLLRESYARPSPNFRWITCWEKMRIGFCFAFSNTWWIPLHKNSMRIRVSPDKTHHQHDFNELKTRHCLVNMLMQRSIVWTALNIPWWHAHWMRHQPKYSHGNDAKWMLDSPSSWNK